MESAIETRRDNMKASGRRMTSGAALLVLILLDSTAALAGARFEVPIKQTVLDNGGIRYSVPVAIAGSQPSETRTAVRSTVAEAPVSRASRTSVSPVGPQTRARMMISRACGLIGVFTERIPCRLESRR